MTYRSQNAISHDQISGVSPSDHHTKYTDSEASNAAPVQSVNGNIGSVNLDYIDVGAASDSHNHDTIYLNETSNLSDLPDKFTARSNLGLSSAAIRSAEDSLTDGSNLPDGHAIKEYGDTNWGIIEDEWIYISDYSDSLSNAVSSISTDTTLVINKDISLTGDVTVPSNIDLFFTKAGVINGAYTLTINGSIRAGLWKIFDSDVTISGTPNIDYVYPEWFGAIGNGSTDDSGSIEKACKFSSVIFTKTYLCNNISIDNSCLLYSNGKGEIRAKANDENDCFLIDSSAQGSKVKFYNLSFDGQGSTQATDTNNTLIKTDEGFTEYGSIPAELVVDSCYFDDVPVAVVAMFGDDSSNRQWLTVKNCTFNSIADSNDWKDHSYIQVVDGVDIDICHNWFYGSGFSIGAQAVNITVSSTDPIVSTFTKANISHNHIYGLGKHYTTSKGDLGAIEFYCHGKDLVIEGNQIADVFYAAAVRGKADSRWMVIANNNIHGSAHNGIAIYQSPYDSSSYGFLIANNMIDYIDYIPIHVSGADSDCLQNAIISNNMIQGSHSEASIDCYNVDGLVIMGNILHGGSAAVNTSNVSYIVQEHNLVR